MNDPAPRLRDADLLKAGAALQRAAHKAQELAHRTATPCYVWHNSKIVNIGAAPVETAAPMA